MSDFAETIAAAVIEMARNSDGGDASVIPASDIPEGARLRGVENALVRRGSTVTAAAEVIRAAHRAMAKDYPCVFAIKEARVDKSQQYPRLTLWFYLENPLQKSQEVSPVPEASQDGAPAAVLEDAPADEDGPEAESEDDGETESERPTRLSRRRKR